MILSYSHAESLIEELRSEAEMVYPCLSTSSRLLRETPKLDSVIREGLRLHVLLGHHLQREVMPLGGVTTPSGLHIPCGSMLSVYVAPVHHSDKIYPDATKFVPYRFLQGQQSRGTYDKWKGQSSAIRTGEHYLIFGLGTHECPGRFYAVQVMKLILVSLLVHYDVEPWQDRPKSTALGDFTYLSDENILRVKRRLKSPS